MKIVWKYVCKMLTASILLLGACSSEKAAFLIEGVFENASNVQVVSLYEGDRKLDSVFLTENGRFKIQRTATQPRLFTLVAGKDRFPVILQNGDQVSIRADLSAGTGDYEVSGSVLSEKIKAFSSIQLERDRFENQMNEEFLSLSSKLDAQALLSMREEYVVRHRVYMQDYTAKTVAFAQVNDDLAGFYAMNTLDRELAEKELIDYAEKIGDRYEENAVVRQFVQEINQLKRLAIGQPAPMFESLTPNNRTVKLSDFQGKYTLLDFWASWCVPCRQENPNIVQQYNKYKDQGFDVLGVSLDGNPGSWLRAIDEDGLEWTNVSDLQAWGSEVVGLYSILAIPTSYLLDPDGKIIAKNLRAKELEQFLEGIFIGDVVYD